MAKSLTTGETQKSVTVKGGVVKLVETVIQDGKLVASDTDPKLGVQQ